MEEVAFLRTTIRTYRACFSELLDLAKASDAHIAHRILEVLVATQRRLDKLKERAPAELLPMEARKREGLVALEEFR